MGFSIKNFLKLCSSSGITYGFRERVYMNQEARLIRAYHLMFASDWKLECEQRLVDEPLLQFEIGLVEEEEGSVAYVSTFSLFEGYLKLMYPIEVQNDKLFFFNYNEIEHNDTEVARSLNNEIEYIEEAVNKSEQEVARLKKLQTFLKILERGLRSYYEAYCDKTDNVATDITVKE